MKLNRCKPANFVLLATFLLSSCGGGGSTKEEESTASEEFDAAAKKQIVADVTKIFKALPPPSEVPYLLMQTGADFDEEVINSVDDEKMAEYQRDESVAALNLGIYATDIGYLASYDKSEIALNYMGECQKLAAPVGVADAIDYGMIARFESNMENKDSLAVIINDVIAKSGERLSQLEEVNSAALLLAGSWIEGIYISTQIVANYPDDLPEEARTLVLEPLVKIVMEQKNSLNDLLGVLSDVESTEKIAEITASLEKVKTIYDNELSDVETQIAENTGDFILKPSFLDNLAAEVNQIRSSIISI